MTTVKTLAPEFEENGVCKRKGECTIMKRSDKPYYKLKLHGKWLDVYAGAGYKACPMRWDMPSRSSANVIIEQKGTMLNIFNPEQYKLVVADDDAFDPVREVKQIL